MKPIRVSSTSVQMQGDTQYMEVQPLITPAYRVRLHIAAAD